MQDPPDSQKLQGAAVGGLALDDLMDALNARIAKRVGREKQLGHSYFLDSGQPVTDPDQFAQRFRQEILPVLQEYCYDDYAALAQYLEPSRFHGPCQPLPPSSCSISSTVDDPRTQAVALVCSGSRA